MARQVQVLQHGSKNKTVKKKSKPVYCTRIRQEYIGRSGCRTAVVIMNTAYTLL